MRRSINDGIWGLFYFFLFVSISEMKIQKYTIASMLRLTPRRRAYEEVRTKRTPSTTLLVVG